MPRPPKRKCDQLVDDVLENAGFKRRVMAACAVYAYEGKDGTVVAHDDCSACFTEGVEHYRRKKVKVITFLGKPGPWEWKRPREADHVVRPTHRKDFFGELSDAMERVGAKGKKKDPHEGMVYNPYSDTWSWF